MYLPKNLWHSKAYRKLQVVGATALIGASLIGCSGTAQETTAVLEIPTITATTIATTVAPPTTQNSSLPPATPSPLPTFLPDETATAVPPTLIPTFVATEAVATEAVSSGQYIDGQYLGDAVRTDRWGNTQVIAHVEGGMLVNVEIAQYPNSKNRSSQISWAAFPSLISEAIENQDADIDIVTRATDTSVAFMQSLDAALEDAKVGASS